MSATATKEFKAPNLDAESPAEASPLDRVRTSSGYVAPETEHGQIVAYYPHAIANRLPQLAAVIGQGMRGAKNLRILGNRQVVEAVPHIGDPKLRQSAERRANGAWDYTDDHKAHLKEMAEIHESIAAVNAKVDSLLSKMDSQPNERQALLQQARELGVQITGNPGIEKLKQLIAEKVAANVAG